METQPGLAATGPAAPRPRGGGRWKGPSAATLLVLATLAAAAGDLATPLTGAVIVVGVALAALAIALGVSAFLLGNRGDEARMAALVPALALCGYAVFAARSAPPGRPPSGVIAQAMPAIEGLQARMLPVKPNVASVLGLEARLKSGGAADSGTLAAISTVGSPAAQRYLYGVAERSGDAAARRALAAVILRQQGDRRLTLELQSEDNLTLESQYLEGSSIRFLAVDPKDFTVRAQLETNAEAVDLAGALSGSTLTLAGKAHLANKTRALTLTAGMDDNLTFSGHADFDGGGSTPFAFRPS